MVFREVRMVHVCASSEGIARVADTGHDWVEGILFPDHPTRFGERLAYGLDKYGNESMFEQVSGRWNRHHHCTPLELGRLELLDGIVKTASRGMSGPFVVTEWSFISYDQANGDRGRSYVAHPWEEELLT